MVIESRTDINGLRRANRATARLLKHLARMAKPGVTTRALDDFARAYIADLGAEPVVQFLRRAPEYRAEGRTEAFAASRGHALPELHD